ncbi:MAG TPA: hypothetical protein VGO77_01180 [Mycobacterium sp.]|jgi:hypothetical protein|nr:hypothetical protein [Mycobacterium sp.]
MKTKAAVLLSGAIVALVLVSRYFALSRAGMPLEWLLYFGLPITAAGVLFALRLINLGTGWHTAVDNSKPGVWARPLAPRAPEELVSERLRQLEDLHTRGAISDTEYCAQRLQIISTM